jgi:putative DNA primase/helicase
MLDKSGEDEPRALANETIPAFSEEALALEYAKEHAPYLRYVADSGKWMIWDNSCWKQDNTLRALDLARRLCRKAAAHANQDAERLANRTTSSNVAFLARADRRLAATTDQWDANPWLLNTPSGTVDLRTGNLRQCEPADYLTQVTACAPAAMECVLWHAFLDRITDKNKELKDYLQLVFGYALSGSTIEHALFFLYGTGRQRQTGAAQHHIGDYGHLSLHSADRNIHGVVDRSSPDRACGSSGGAIGDGDRDRRRSPVGGKPDQSSDRR